MEKITKADKQLVENLETKTLYDLSPEETVCLCRNICEIANLAIRERDEALNDVQALKTFFTHSCEICAFPALLVIAEKNLKLWESTHLVSECSPCVCLKLHERAEKAEKELAKYEQKNT